MVLEHFLEKSMANNHFDCLVNPDSVLEHCDKASPHSHIHIRVGMGDCKDPYAPSPRKRLFSEMKWEIPGVGEVSRGEAMKILQVSRLHLAHHITRHKQKQILPHAWRLCLWLCARNNHFKLYCQTAPADFRRRPPELEVDYKLSNTEIRLLFNFSPEQLKRARKLGSCRSYSVVYEWLDRFPPFVLEQLICCRRFYGGLSEGEEQVLSRLEERLVAD